MRLRLFCLLAFGLSTSVQAQALNQVYQVQGYSCYKAKDNSGEVVEYCTPVPAKSLEDFKVPMHGYLTEEGRLDSARKYAKNKDKEVQRAQNPELSKPIIPVPAGVSGGRSGSTATTSAGGDLQRKNPQYVVEKAEIAAKQTAEEARIKAEKARALFEAGETDIEARLRAK